MRKIDVFGRKINQTKPLYLIILVFILVISAYYAIIQLQARELENLENQAEELNAQIDQILNANQELSYHEIGEVIQYLPNTYNQTSIISDLNFVKNVSGLALATGYQTTFTVDTTSPFTETLPSTIRFVRIVITMNIEDPLLVLDYVDYLIAQDQIYYVKGMNVNYLSDGSASVQLDIYTFYNAVDIS